MISPSSAAALKTVVSVMATCDVPGGRHRQGVEKLLRQVA